jgi:hypothetical protein
VVAAAIVYACSAIAAVRHFGDLAPAARLVAADVLVDDGAIPNDPIERTSGVDTWCKGRERDPRVRLFRAIRQARADDLAGAEREARAGLSERAILEKFFPDRNVEVQLRTVLCSVLVDEGRRDDAITEARPVCDAADGGTVPEFLEKMRLCDAP